MLTTVPSVDSCELFDATALITELYILWFYVPILLFYT